MTTLDSARVVPFEVRDGRVFDPDSGRWRVPAFSLDPDFMSGAVGSGEWPVARIPGSEDERAVHGVYRPGGRQCDHRDCEHPAVSPEGLCEHHVGLKRQMDERQVRNRRLCARSGCPRQRQAPRSHCAYHIALGEATNKFGERVIAGVIGRR